MKGRERKRKNGRERKGSRKGTCFISVYRLFFLFILKLWLNVGNVGEKNGFF